MAVVKTLDTLYVNGVAYKVAHDSTIQLQVNWTAVTWWSFTLNQDDNKTINIVIDKTTVGLWNVDNTSDLNKPVSTATQTALDAKQDELTAGANITITEDQQTWELVIAAVDTTYNEVTTSDMNTGTATTPWVVSAKGIADYVAWKIAGVYRVKWSVQNYSDLANIQNPVVWDVYNVVNWFTKDWQPYPAGTNVVYYETSTPGSYDWDPMGWTIDLSSYFNKSTDDSDDITEGSTHLFMTTAERTNLGNQSWVNTGDQSASDFDIKDLTDSTGLRNTWSGKQDAFYQTAASAPATANEWDQYYNTTDNKLYVYDWTDWKAVDEDARAAWWNISGTLADQTDLQNALNDKLDVTDLGNATITVNTIDLDWDGTHTEGSFTTNQSSNGTINVRSSVIVESSDYADLPSTKNSDNNFYFTFTEKTVS